MKILLHKWLKFRNEQDDILSKEKDAMFSHIGNVTINTQITFEYKLKSPLEIRSIPIAVFSNNVPFQTQIEFSALDMSKRIYVVTQVLDISYNKDQLFAEANHNVLQINAIEQVKKRVRIGDLKGAQVTNLLWNKKIKAKEGSSFNMDMEAMQEHLQKNYQTNTTKYVNERTINDDVIIGTTKLQKEHGTFKLN
jgi:hypothetical protein